MQQGWAFGSRYSLYMMSSAQKRNFDLVIPVENLTENQVDVTNEDGVNVISTVAIWKSTFGQIKFIMDPVLDQFPAEWAERFILGFDERQEYRPKICWLPGRGWGVEALAKVGDTDQEQIVGECTLEVPNPKSVMLVAGLSENLCKLGLYWVVVIPPPVTSCGIGVSTACSTVIPLEMRCLIRMALTHAMLFSLVRLTALGQFLAMGVLAHVVVKAGPGPVTPWAGPPFIGTWCPLPQP